MRYKVTIIDVSGAFNVNRQNLVTYAFYNNDYDDTAKYVGVPSSDKKGMKIWLVSNCLALPEGFRPTAILSKSVEIF